MRNVRLFVSSPGDVGPERQRVQWVADRLNGEFAQILHIETVLWESAVYNAHDAGFQPQIDRRARPADCDIVLSIFWSRLGTELPPEFPERMPDGKPYPSGTAYEVLTALEERRANQHRPDVFVFRKNVIPTVPINDRAAREEADRQWDRLEDFFGRYFELADKRILRVVERFREIGEFEGKVELLLRDWIRSNVSQGTIWPIEQKGSPFRGLEPFEAKHADVYCGRDRKVLRAIDELVGAARRGKPFLLIPGASGSGKSSLMRAGMAPRIVRPGTVNGVDLWRTAVMRPGSDANPLLALSRALFVTGNEKDDPGGFGLALPELAQGPFKTPERLAQLLAGPADVVADPILAALEHVGQAETARRHFERPLQTNLLLLVDQLEEIFAASVTPEQRAQFANVLAALVNTQRVWLIATLRGDMYEHMITERPFVILKDICGQFDLGPPGADELDEIVHRSAEAAGLQYEVRADLTDPTGQRRERLDDRLLRDAAGEHTLPLLQFALNLLFEKCWVRDKSKVLCFAAYETFGGLDGAINQTAEVALARLVQPVGDIAFPLEPHVAAEIDGTINPRLEVLGRKLVIPVGGERDGADGTAARALTARIVPLPEARRDPATGQLVDALVQARILLASHGEQGSTLRLAHDRVMTSWKRARDLIEKNRDFVRIRDAIEHARRRYEEHGRSPEFFIPAGTQIAQAEDVLRRFGDEFSEPTRVFVALSGRRARRRQRLLQTFTVIFGIVALVATAAAVLAYREWNQADQSYKDARATVNELVTDFARGLRDRDGIQVQTIEDTLNTLKPLVDKLARQNQNDPELKRINGSMHFEFAKAFQNSRDLARALREAEEGVKIRNELVQLPAVQPEWQADLALSFEQEGDIRREMAKALLANADPQAAAEFDTAGKLFQQSYDIRERLHKQEPDKPTWAYAMSQSLVRMGDLKVSPAKDYAGARTNFEGALALIKEVVRREPDNVTWQRELAWDFNKVGDILRLTGDVQDGLASYDNGLRTRRYIANNDPANTLYKRDVAFSLEKIGDARCDTRDFDGAETAMFEALDLREQLIRADRSQTLWLLEYTDTLQKVGACLKKRGDAVLAAGFFALAIERLQTAPGTDLRAKQSLTNASAGYSTLVGQLSPDVRKQAADATALSSLLKEHATGKEGEMARLREANQIDIPGDWEQLKETVLNLPSEPGEREG
jgi:tetratricopeptide (TPR) repeat protein